MGLKIFEYKKCSTCQRALKFLDSKNIKYETFPIIDNPPSMGELKKMLKYLKDNGESFKKLFNTSGEVYRELNMSEKIRQGLSEEQALELLSKNGKLIKRPFALSDTAGTVGFQETLWAKIFGIM